MSISKTHYLLSHREATSLDFESKIKFSNMLFSSYLAGLIEGDGYIYVPQTKRDFKGRLIYPSIQLCFASKDLPLALLIQKNLNVGVINKKKGLRAYLLTINNVLEIRKVVSLINGFMRTPKNEILHSLINWLNQNNSSDFLNIKPLPLDTSDLSQNSWLAGFIDAEGHFSLRVESLSKTILNKTYIKIECRFEVEQREIDLSGLSLNEIMLQIAHFLETSVKLLKRDQNGCKTSLRLRTLNINSNLKLCNYLSEYPLFSSKYLDFKDWSTVFNLFVQKKHLTEQGLTKIKNIKLQMNTKRHFFSWNHLNNFYELHL